MSSSKLSGALATEFTTVCAMIAIYCRRHHHSQSLCDQCSALKQYAELRLDRCPYGDRKPTCNQCPIHCYKPAEKEQMRQVMRYAGPRMLLVHPILAVRHLIHERKPAPAEYGAENSNRHKRMAKEGRADHRLHSGRHKR